MKSRSACAVIAFAAALVVGSGLTAQADPISDLINPSHDPAAYLPTPLGDPWFDPPAGFENLAPGTVLNTRSVTVPRIATPATTTQLLFRSTDSKNRPIAAATSVIVPTAPWTGAGPRPIASYNIAIDSLGNTCAPSYTLPRGTAGEMDSISDLVARNFAVVVTDYEGPRQAYSAGLVSGHTVLDSVRAAENHAELGLSKSSPVGITGYSGGAIASGWAAQLAPTYAPELNIVGVAFGGAPTDYNLLHSSLNGHIGSGLYLAATAGLTREYPELGQFNNDNGRRYGLLQKDQCADVLSYAGIFMLSQEQLSESPNSFTNPIVQKVIAENRMGGAAPKAPIFIYQGIQDVWIPKEGAEAVYDEWCAKGASVRLEETPGDHTTIGNTARPGAIAWLAQRLNGQPAQPGCSSIGR
ncbi:lipase family protein [Antrihabitans cavernicola]|uniref:Lipase n=1 Tax=Antrihabitans cavernicola TaxID=2495913 RepID=A0A5A7S852_9NOCA|nr:lipase family protein [Spelaeibacter cavernicola]KAA0021654.1 lipase [Spelaeibacter cavernicola]